MVTPEILSKYRDKSIAYLEDKLQELVNAKVRKRDSLNGFFICICCQELKPINQMNASHYYPKEVKQYRAVSFDSYDAKVEFLEFLGFNPEDKFIKGEELQEKTAEAYAS